MDWEAAERASMEEDAEGADGALAQEEDGGLEADGGWGAPSQPSDSAVFEQTNPMVSLNG